MSDPQEQKLLRQIKEDSEVSMKTIFDTHHKSLCTIAFRLTKDQDIAKDVVQEVFVKFWNNRKSLAISSSLTAYLRRSVVNQALNHLDRMKRYPKIQLDQIVIPAATNSSDDAVKFNELADQISRAIDRLPVRPRAIFILIRDEEMSYQEVAQTLNISTKAVEKDMMKALKSLREMLAHLLPVVALCATFL